MASLLNRILSLLGRAASDAVSDALAQKPSTSPDPSGSTPAGSADPGKPTAPVRARSPKSSPTSSSPRGVGVYDISALGLPAFSYSPDPDGDADPGEVVWAWVPFEEDPAQGKDRPVPHMFRISTPAGRWGRRTTSEVLPSASVLLVKVTVYSTSTL